MSSVRALPVLGTLLLLLAGGPVLAQGGAAPQASVPGDGGPSLGALRITGAPPVVDGRLDEAVWSEAPVAGGFIQRRPNAGAPASSPTEVRVVYTEGALYVGARLTDHPDSIAAQLSRRDNSRIYSDWFQVMLDSDDDNRSAYVLGVNPREVQRDFIVAEDGSTDVTWDAVWEVRTSVDSLGWTAEFRIPLSQLRFNRGRSEWGLNFQRVIARSEEEAYWAPIPPNASGFVSRFGSLAGITDVASPTRLELMPYAVSRLTRAPGSSSNPFYDRNEPSASMGLDLRYSLTPNFTLRATANPDFGQVEADPSEVNLTAFETSFSEQRPFFVEDAGIFRFNMGGSSGQLLYTRRIGAGPRGSVPSDAVFSDYPERTTILGAAKVSGKTSSGWSMGVLSALTSREEARYVLKDGERDVVPVEPLTNFSTARVMRDFGRGRSALGGIVTVVNRHLNGTELDFLRSSAATGGIDGRHRFGGSNYEVSGFLVGSNIQGSERALRSVQTNSTHYFQRPGAPHLEVDSTLTSMSGFIGNLEVEKIGGGHWGWELGVRGRSPGLEVNDFGFQQQTDRIEEYGGVDYNQFRPGRVFRSWNVGVFHRNQWTFGRERIQTNGSLEGSFQHRDFWGGSASVERDQAGLSTSELRGGPSLVIPGRTVMNVSFYGDRRRAAAWSVAGGLALQDQTDGYTAAITPSVALRPSPRMDLSLTPAVTWNEVPAQYIRQRRGTDGVVRYYFGRLEQTTASLTARLSYTLTPRLSLQYYAQPFISAGDYSEPKEVVDPRASRFEDRFRPTTLDALPDFNVKQFRSNAVLRWEYRPGSTLFVVWNSALQERLPVGAFNLFSNARDLFSAEGTNVLLVKVSYWFGL